MQGQVQALELDLGIRHGAAACWWPSQSLERLDSACAERCAKGVDQNDRQQCSPNEGLDHVQPLQRDALNRKHGSLSQ